jgi:hypothetical protein
MPWAEYFSRLVNLNQQNDPQAKNDERDQEMNIGNDGFRGSHQGHSFRSFQRCIKICTELLHSQNGTGRPATMPVWALLSASFRWFDIESHVAQTGIDQIHRICSVVDTKPGSIGHDTYL